MFEADIVGIGDGAVHLQRLEALPLEAGLHVHRPVPAKPARFNPHVHLGVVHERAVGDLVFLRQLIGVFIGDPGGALRLFGVHIRPERANLMCEFGDLLIGRQDRAIGAGRTGCEGQNGEKRQET